MIRWIFTRFRPLNTIQGWGLVIAILGSIVIPVVIFIALLILSSPSKVSADFDVKVDRYIDEENNRWTCVITVTNRSDYLVRKIGVLARRVYQDGQVLANIGSELVSELQVGEVVTLEVVAKPFMAKNDSVRLVWSDVACPKPEEVEVTLIEPTTYSPQRRQSATPLVEQ